MDRNLKVVYVYIWLKEMAQTEQLGVSLQGASLRCVAFCAALTSCLAPEPASLPHRHTPSTDTIISYLLHVKAF